MRLLYTLFLVLAFAAPVAADEVSVNRDAVYLFDTIMSPYCPGRTLSACPSEDARALRDEITMSLQAGSSIEDEQRRLMNRFGPDVLGRPVGAGALWSWGLPVGFLFAGVLLIGYVAKRRKREESAAAPLSEPDESSARSKVEAEIRRRMQE